MTCMPNSETAAFQFRSSDRRPWLGSMPPFFFCRVPPLRQALEFSASHYVILLAKCRSISLFPTSATKALGAFRGYANPSKLSAPDHCISGKLNNIFASDDERPSVKKPTQRIEFPTRLPLRTGGRKPSKSIVAPNASSSETAEIPCRNIKTTRCKLERLPVDEPAFLKTITQVVTEEVPVDQIVRYASSLMGIARVSWKEAVAMLTKAPSILNLEVSRLEQSVAFLTDVGLSKEDISSLLVSHPRFFDYDVEEMKRNVEYLISIGLPEDDVAIVLRERPQALNARMEDVIFSMECLLEAQVLPQDFARILSSPAELFSSSARDYLKSRFHFFKQVGLHGSSLGKGIARRPNLLRFDLEPMKEAYNYLSKFLPPNDVSKLVRRFAEVLVIDTKRKMEPMVNHLLQLGVNPSHLGKVLVRRPQLLGYTVAGLEPTVQYLKELGVAGQTLGRVISISPQVITLNCEGKLKPAVEFLRSIGLQDSKDMERVLLRSGQLLRCSIDKNLAPKFRFFRDLGLKREDVVKILVLFPSMFGQSIELALEPKYRYLVDVMHRIPAEIVDFPQYFGYSLEKRIKPRYEKLIAKGVTNLSLSSMFACLEADFVSRYLTGTPRLRTCNKVKKGVRKSKCAG